MTQAPFHVPVITIDGPTASGKGTVAQRVAEHLGWHVLDSGALYRLTALACLNIQTSLNDEEAVALVASQLDVSFKADKVFLSQADVSQDIRAEHVGNTASKIAAYPQLRLALLQRQRDFQVEPGLVADGRDMGTIVFPDANLKIFLVADVQSRAERRAKQLKAKGISANLTSLLEDMQARDLRDSSRASAPLVAADDAYVIDSSNLTIEETVGKVLLHWSEKIN
ncbi:(d)CMP kinase [Paenalcaligenes niemegkensis]|uniref:(d)CMP kinase n=1 Tax=Paenalcaligenes niemegkensis TaxID=2895469 RepID=UPI002151A264|nr:(d)CMP kinase [Paenalcaligenes niemegkensis]